MIGLGADRGCKKRLGSSSQCSDFPSWLLAGLSEVNLQWRVFCVRFKLLVEP